MGSGYNLWARIVDETLNKLNDFLEVMANAKKDPLLIKKHFLLSWDPKSPTKLASNNGPCGTITNMQSDDYPQAANLINKFFIQKLLPFVFPQVMTPPGTFMFQLTGEMEKESKAKKGITKLMLMHVCGTID